MVSPSCVSEYELRAFLLGDLPDEACQSVADHLEACATCEATAARLDALTDPILQGLRQSVGNGDTDRLPGAGDPPSTGAESLTWSARGATPRRQVTGYELMGQVGRGGMGVVYKARDVRLGRVVALKMIRGGADADQEMRDRFRREAEAMALLQHPHVVQIFEVGESEGVPFLAMEFADGGSLARRLTGGPLPAQHAARMMESLARAVGYAHGRGVLHRDLTPANVMLLADGTPKVTDFGLAQLLAGSSTLTHAGAVMGTPSYLAPEQADGRSHALGPATDVYALGAVLYELLTGRPPFRAATPLETLAQVVRDEPAPPRRLQSKTPRDLETVCLKCLAKDPRKRYASADDLADDLRRFLNGEPIAARPIGSVGRAWSWARRCPGPAALATAVAALLLLIAVGASGLTLQLNDALQVSGGQRFRAEEAEQKTNARLWESYLEEARAIRLSGRPGQRFRCLRSIREAQRLPLPPGHSRAELRNEVIACLMLPDVEADRELPNDWAADTTAVAFDPTFDRYARADKDGNLSIHRVADGGEIVSLATREKVAFWQGLSFSPDGRFLVSHTQEDGRVILWRLDPLERLPVLQVETARYEWNLPFSPDSRLMAVVNKDHSIGVYDLDAGSKVREVATLLPGFGAERLALSPGQPRLAVAGGGTLRILDVKTGRPVGRDLTHPRRVNCVNWHPDGRTLVTACDDLKIRLWDADSGAPFRAPLEGHRGLGIIVAFNPTGDRLVSNDWSGLMRLWDVPTGRQLLAVAGASTMFSADGRLLAYQLSGSRVCLLRFAPSAELRTVATSKPPDVQRYENARYSPDGRFLLVNRMESLAFIDAASGVEVAEIPSPLTTAMQFEPSGALLTCGNAGLLRWPVVDDPATAARRVGPPQVLDPTNDHGMLLRGSADGAVVAAPRFDSVSVLQRPHRWRTLGPREDMRHCAVSPDGRWVAGGNHNNVRGVAATVWDANTGAVEKDFILKGSQCRVGFSPDGAWLLTTATGFRLWRVGTWEEGPHVADPNDRLAGFAFGPHGGLLALSGDFSQVRLVRAADGTEVARLTVPEQTRLEPQCFSPDGAQFVAIGSDSNLLYIWDLRAVRAELRELDLDWEWPDFKPPLETRPIRIELDGGDQVVVTEPAGTLAMQSLGAALQPYNPGAYHRGAMALAALQRPAEAVTACSTALDQQPDHVEAHALRGRLYRALGQPRQAVPDFEALVRLRPGEARGYRERVGIFMALRDYQSAPGDLRTLMNLEPESARWPNDLAWLLVTGPDAIRDPERALVLSRKAMAIDPCVIHRNTLGLVYYRLGRFEEARDLFAENLESPHPAAGFDLFFLAMCRQQLGEEKPARDCFARAVVWRKAQTRLQPNWQSELDTFEAEARAVLDHRDPSPR